MDATFMNGRIILLPRILLKKYLTMLAGRNLKKLFGNSISSSRIDYQIALLEKILRI